VKKHIQYFNGILCAVCQYGIISSMERTDKELKSSKFVIKQYIYLHCCAQVSCYRHH